jgi:hypothetical protein
MSTTHGKLLRIEAPEVLDVALHKTERVVPLCQEPTGPGELP